ncbi:hypothetical protein V8F20_004789, partial [Naviculisporaceae sp. PSN 640]
MPVKGTDPKKVLNGKVDVKAKRIGTTDDIGRLQICQRFPDHKAMRYDCEWGGALPKATGLPSKSKKRKSTDGDDAGPAAKKSKSSKGNANKPDPLDVTGISLDHDLDDEGDVKVFDTCDTIRKKIKSFLTKHDGEFTQAAFLRAISTAAFAETEPHRKIQHAQLTTFMGQRGTMTGNITGVYYAAYVFFEKLRIKEGKPKSADRKIVEAYHKKGLDRSLAPEHVYYLVPMSAQGLTMDKYGRPNVYYGSDWKGNADGYDKDNIVSPEDQIKMLDRQFQELEETGRWILPPGFPLPGRD